MINRQSIYLDLLGQRRPLVTILLFALISSSILIVLQTIADHPVQDDESLSGNPSRLNEANAEFRVIESPGLASHSKTNEKYSNTVRDLGQRIADLKRIKGSVREELKSLQREKIQILNDKASLINRNEKLLAEIAKTRHHLKQLELDFKASKKHRDEVSCQPEVVAPIVFKPMLSSSIEDYAVGGRRSSPQKEVDAMYHYDISLCPLTSRFRFNTTFDSELLFKIDENISETLDLTTLTGTLLQSHPQYKQVQDVCMTVILLENSPPPLHSRNNLLIDVMERPNDGLITEDVRRRTYIASSSFRKGRFRQGVDVVIPSIIQPPDSFNAIVGSMPLQSPLSRKYLASYFGSTVRSGRDLSQTDQILQTIHRSSIDDMFLFIYDCTIANNKPCHNGRDKMIEMSTFLVIIPDESHDIDRNTNDLIYMALAKSSIPVIFGSERIKLPFDEVIDWRRCTILLPSARLPELHFILRSLAPADVYSLKYSGRRIFENYLATVRQVIDATLSLISLNRLNFPPSPVEQTKTETHVPNQELLLDVNCSLTACKEAKLELVGNSLLAPEILGPREIPFASFAFVRNFSLTLINAYDLWNSPMHSPSRMYPSHPLDPVAPSEYKYLDSDSSYRPIAEGLGGSGVEFSEALGGDYPNEQFTIVLLTYDRIEMMMRTLERLRGLAYLNKVLVVWNGIHRPPPKDLIWPDVGVPIVLVKVERNSLNNRFLPYDAIETDAVFSMDDDSPLRADEIVFAFRVWRESRDRIVGFPGRFHAWDGYQNSWMYNSNHSCELSMVLTGGAFFHKYYSYVYTQLMPETIRSIVDKFMNCEDIAMNFLVAHLTRKPPIKVTSRWTFHCATCTSSLSEDDTHFMERHECLNVFTSIYGYMPLLNTQHRSDSILFKTRLPRDKQKCFRFV